MFLAQATAHANELLGVLKKHSQCLDSLTKKINREPKEKAKAAIASLETDLKTLKDQTHYFACQCRLDRPGTEQLVQTVQQKFSGCLCQIENILEKLKAKPLEKPFHSEWYLRYLEKGVEYCRTQLFYELNLNYGTASESLAPTAGMATGTHSATPGFAAGPQASLQVVHQSEALAVQPLPPQASLFSAGTTPTPLPAESEPPTEETPFLEELLSHLKPGVPEREMKRFVIRFLKHFEKMIRSSAPARKRGRKGRNQPLVFEEVILLLLLANFDLLLIKFLGCKATYEFFALLGGGNSTEAGIFLREFRKAGDDRSRDPRYNLQGKHPELVARAVKLIGTQLPKAILAFVKR